MQRLSPQLAQMADPFICILSHGECQEKFFRSTMESQAQANLVEEQDSAWYSRPWRSIHLSLNGQQRKF